ncbi:actin filament-associated protein 1-like isoform X3 [Asterias rubens]|uniref:actin filament-associated protein 1-like isoform X3 n=1 Tax=Asterias rubens TaxID=7604 RepID=UPI00145572E3|nr:actin filament-associated protein 1-like isoform X3 [Asterias rubens]
MNKLDALEDLLPGFQRFLTDLTTIRLTSDLEAQVNQYNQSIQDYIEQHCTIPSSPPPEPPTAATNGIKKESGDDFIAKQRELARSAHTTSADDSYYNVRVGQQTTETDNSASQGLRQWWSRSFRVERTTFKIDNFYEPPTKLQTPPVPTTKRPPIRVIDDMEAYEDPDDFVPEKPVKAPVKKYGVKSSTMPHLSMPASSEPEATDSGGTFISFNSSSSSQPQEELSDYEMMPDHMNFRDEEDSWGSTDYEDYDEDEIQRNQTVDVDANANAKKKKDKFDIFKQQYEKDPKVDHLGILYSQGKGKTISKKSFGQWDKRYCLAKDMHLLGYKNYDSKKHALDMVLFGFDVSFVGQEGKRKNVFSLNHPNRGTELFSAESKEDADKWIEVLKNYATMGNELVPSTGYVEKSETSTRTTSEDLTAKVVGTVANFFKREKKGKDMSPQLSIDDKGYLSGYINVMGAKYGESKWRKKFITIEKGYLTCYTEDGDVSQFKFPLEGREMMLAGQKEAKRKGSMKIMKDGEVLIYIEALNPLDMGHLLKKFMEEMTQGQRKESTAQRGMVSDILKAFEKQGGEGAADQPVVDEFYDDVQLSPEPASPKTESSSIYQNFKIRPKHKEDIPKEDIYDYAEYQNCVPVEEHLQVPTGKKVSAPSIYQNFKVAVQQAGKKKMPSSPKLTKKDSEEAESKKDKKAKKKDKGKKDKKSKEKEEEIAKEEAKEEEEEVARVEAAKKIVKRQSVINKFEKSDKKHLLDVDRLEIERKEVEGKKREVTKRKIDLRSQKMESTDPKQKELIEGELKKAQQSWSECSNRLAFINMEIERFTKGGEANMRIEEKQQFRMSMVRELSFKEPAFNRRSRDRLSLCAMKSWSLDTASAEMAKNGISESAKKDSATISPGMEVMSKSAGNVQNKLKMFQQMNSK